ncbi:hypothetical protein BGZ94_004936 [Podila epigama]|nr:hypothetical protein BGZ94_004936 [Podila epigama]
MKFAVTFLATLSTLSSLIATTVAAPAAPWTYGLDNAGPQHWGNLDPLYGTCGTGHRQSPIDIALGAPYVTLQKKKLLVRYKPLRNVLCGYDGHAVKCEWPSQRKGNSTNANNSNTITIKGKKYSLINFHFHTPSEHRVNNHFADGELHLVHQAKDGSLAVIGFLLELQARSNPFFDFVVALGKKVDHASAGHGFLIKDSTTGEPVLGKEQVKYKVPKIDFTPLIKASGTFTPRWEYEGSLTVPPCTEGVAWQVVKTAIPLGLEQYDTLVNLQAFNARFIQDRPRA